MTPSSIQAHGCPCGRDHTCDVRKVLTGVGALTSLPHELAALGITKPFILCDPNTYKAAAAQVEALLSENGMAFTTYRFSEERPEPDEYAVGAAVMHFDKSCDGVLAVGSGVVGDVSKLLAGLTGLPYAIVATAPSMDGYASATSSMTRGGLKVSIPSACAALIVGDTEILKNAPAETLISGLGDMLAKYISIVEWRISHILTGEYYCAAIADLVRDSLRACVDNVEGLLRREDEAVEAVFNGLVLCGMAMSLAGCSRPASGVEHYFSHLWDMRGAEFGTPTSTHGIQCALGTLYAVRLYEAVKSLTPDRGRALAYAEQFDLAAWNTALREFLGRGAEAMIALEEKEGKYDLAKHAARLSVIAERWEELTSIMEELPPATEVERILRSVGCPVTPEEMGLESALLPMTLKASKDIRDKYVLSRLLWDLGLLDDFSERICEI